MLGVLGHPFDTGWGDLFVQGSSVGDPERYPAIDEIRRVLGAITERFYAVLQSLDDERARTAAEQLAGFAMHDSYHVGQLAYVRKGFGYSAVAG
jgi:hypothetical protein